MPDELILVTSCRGVCTCGQARLVIRTTDPFPVPFRLVCPNPDCGDTLTYIPPEWAA